MKSIGIYMRVLLILNFFRSSSRYQGFRPITSGIKRYSLLKFYRVFFKGRVPPRAVFMGAAVIDKIVTKDTTRRKNQAHKKNLL
jgi:hypothetical protein